MQKLLEQSPPLRLAVQGHTDNEGTTAHNQQLSEARAKSVVAALTAASISAGRLQAAGFGQTQPLADNATEAGRAQNRRVELVKR
ncbi:OmpA family protein [Hymenobacter lapidiphilus]|uniref:OmpA family protein n=1 Tax=Hymenobacter sp. CCM 8763 TaxID=2303334 RepID=UPI001F5B8CB9|nr:OmpA family protein [Hymenobacter sp. CCM 8763]